MLGDLQTRVRLEAIAAHLSKDDAAFLRKLAVELYMQSICGARIHIGGGMFDICGQPRDDGHKHR